MSVTDRDRALTYWERQLKLSKRMNDEDLEYVQEAVNALRRSLDHTAIQTKLNSAMSLLRELIDIEGPQPGHVEWFHRVQKLVGSAQQRNSEQK